MYSPHRVPPSAKNGCACKWGPPPNGWRSLGFALGMFGEATRVCSPKPRGQPPLNGGKTRTVTVTTYENLATDTRKRPKNHPKRPPATQRRKITAGRKKYRKITWCEELGTRSQTSWSCFLLELPSRPPDPSRGFHGIP